MQLTRPSRAFSLVELIMVVTIIGVMAVFVIPNYSKAVQKSYEKAGSNNLLTIYSAQMIKNNSDGKYYVVNNTNEVNSVLGLGIIGNGIDYKCPAPQTTDTQFTCWAVHGTFTLQITNVSSNACCSTGPCYSVPAC